MKRKIQTVLSVLFVATLLPLQSNAHSPWWMDDEGARCSDPMQCNMMGPGMMGSGMMMGQRMGFGMMGGPGGMGMAGMMMGGLDMLDLTDKQAEAINDIQSKLEKDHWKLHGKMLDLQDKMRDVWRDPKPDPKKVGDVYEEISKLHRQGLEAQVKAMNEIYDLLTEEQRKNLRYGYGPMRGSMHHHGHMMNR